MARIWIVVLAVVALGVLYSGMKREQNAPDPTKDPTFDSILSVIHDRNLSCDRVIDFRRLGSGHGWVFYFARCNQGGHYVYMQSAGEGKVYAASCDEMGQRGWYCPSE